MLRNGFKNVIEDVVLWLPKQNQIVKFRPLPPSPWWEEKQEQEQKKEEQRKKERKKNNNKIRTNRPLLKDMVEVKRIST